MSRFAYDSDILGEINDAGVESTPMGKSFGSNAAGTPPSASASSSKAVLAALRALQDKIRRLESERAQAIDEASQIRSQLKNQELETSHWKEKERFASEKAMQETRVILDKLKAEKFDTENRLLKAEERNKETKKNLEDLQARIVQLESDNTLAGLRQKELLSQHHQLENQLHQCMQREKDLSQTMLWETKRHEEEVAQLEVRLHNLRCELDSANASKSANNATLSELDQLVAQLLSVNESLVSQLAGKNGSASIPRKIPGPMSGHAHMRSASPAVTVPRAAFLSTVASDASRAVKVYGKAALTAQAKATEIEHLTQLHNMFAKLAKGISQRRNDAPSKKKEKADPSISNAGRKTRLSKRKENVSHASFASVDDSAIEHHIVHSSPSNATGKRYSLDTGSILSRPAPKDVYIPTGRVIHNDSTILNTSVASVDDVSGIASLGDSGSRAGHAKPISSIGDMKDVISSLEDEFDALNNQYSQLLSSVKAASNNESTQAEELVNVIQKLHRKGEQLRQLKSPPRN